MLDSLTEARAFIIRVGVTMPAAYLEVDSLYLRSLCATSIWHCLVHVVIFDHYISEVTPPYSM